jgi:L-ascorbate metabolism protein UlaG (beta-lactamase superfamily)
LGSVTTDRVNAEKKSGRRLTRRALIGGLGAAGLTGTATLLYRQAPSFWQQYFSEMNRPIHHPRSIPDPSRWSDTGIHAAWLGHATVLLKIDGFTIITDPIFSDRAGIDLRIITLGVKRLIAPALPVEQLPDVDLVLLSHAHMDHFDLPSLRALESRRRNVVTAWETSDLLRVSRYKQVQEARWGQTLRVGPATIRAFEVNHWGARMRTDTYRGYNGYTIQVGRYRVLFAGDTADTHAFTAVRESKPYDLAIMPIGAYNPWIRYHCTPEQAWRMGNEAGSEFFIPVHHQTFALSREPFQEPLERFRAAAGSNQDRVAIHQIGEEFQLT